MKELIEELVRAYQKYPHRRRLPDGKWKQFVEGVDGSQYHSFDEIYTYLKEKSHEFSKIGREEVWYAAVQIAEKYGIPYDDCIQCLLRKRQYVSYLAENKYLQCVPFYGWDLVNFLLVKSYALQRIVREDRRNKLAIK